MLKPVFLSSRSLRLFALGTGMLLAERPVPVLAQTAPASSPKLLVKGGLRLNHLFYLPDGRSWQLVLPSSLGLEYGLKPRVSLYAQAEADVSAGHRPRGRRGSFTLPTASTDLSLGARYYFNQPTTSVLQPVIEPWGNYVALEIGTQLTQAGGRGRRGRGLNSRRTTPAVFAFCGTQRSGPGRRLLYDLNAGIGVESATYNAEPSRAHPWNVAAQVNLRVCLINHRRTAKPLLTR